METSVKTDSCTVEGCTKKCAARGLCGTHYSQYWRRTNQPPGSEARLAYFRRRSELNRIRRQHDSAFRKLQRSRERKYAYRSRYGITKERYDAVVASLGGACALCKNPEKKIITETGFPRPLSVEHCHKTGVNRGIVCQSCNFAIGIIEKFTNFCVPTGRLAAYLEGSSEEFASLREALKRFTKK